MYKRALAGFCLSSLMVLNGPGLIANGEEIGGACADGEGPYLICGEAETAANIIANSFNHGRSLAVGWRAPDNENWPYAEIYAFQMVDGLAMVGNPLSLQLDWVTKEQLANHVTVVTSWSGNTEGGDLGFAIAVNGKWETRSVHLATVNAQKKVISHGEQYAAIEGEIYAGFATDQPEIDVDTYTLTLTRAPQVGRDEFKTAEDPNVILMTAVFQQPKGDSLVFEYEVAMTIRTYKQWSYLEVSNFTPLETN